MRVILMNKPLRSRDAPEVPQDVVGLASVEAYSVGPLSAWPDADTFRAERAAFWRETPRFTDPDGQDIDYFDWYQVLPIQDVMALIALGKKDFPEPLTYGKAIGTARQIEIWADKTADAQLWLWSVIADLARRGFDPGRVTLCDFGADMWRERPAPFWSALIADTPEREIPARPLAGEPWAHGQALWSAVLALPNGLEPGFALAPHEARVFDVLRGRSPDPQTGLNNLETRLLRALRSDWTKMARIIGEAMVAGHDVGDSVGDGILQWALEGLAQRTPALAQIEGSGAMRFCTVRLTAEGAALQQRLA